MVEWLDTNVGREYKNFIGGSWKESVSGETYPVYNPAIKEQVLGYFPNSEETDVNEAVEAASKAFTSWSKVSAPERSMILIRFADLLEENAEELAFMLSAEQGKALAESRGEVKRAATETRFAAGEALRIEGKTLPGERSNVMSSTVRYPIGVIAAIAPWNFPVVTPVRKIAPALAYGCTVVFKPASDTPWTSVKLMELFAEAGVPDGVVNLVIGGGSKVGNPLVNHPLVKGISFTGSTGMGTSINETAAKRLVRTQLELGGKNPAVVLDYDNVTEVAKQITGAAFTCSGQRCTAISRIIVTKEKAEELTLAIIEEMKKIKVGPSWEPGVTMGPLVSEEHLNTVREYVQIGIQEGARLRYGGEVLDSGEYAEGHYMVPALFDGVETSMRISQEEIFGPVLSVLAVESEEEAFAAANNSAYGLAASIFTNNLSSAYRFAEQIQSGMVHVNHGTASAAHMPFGGVKNSGHGAFSIGSSNSEFYTEQKVLYFQY
ncbi:aldehyde dehydrogenase [Bacillus sp. M6-12]|nr:aldehyde dehydrogenase [Bacillus sp. M6-12]